MAPSVDTEICAYHFHFHDGLIAVVEEVPGFPTVNPNYTQKELTTETESHWSLVWVDDGLDTVRDILLEDVRLRKLALQVG